MDEPFAARRTARDAPAEGLEAARAQGAAASPRPRPAPARPPEIVRPEAAEPEPARGLALWRGWRMRCPRCGEGRLLRAYLKVRDECPHCGLALHHARADDGPAWLTILVVGHVMAPLLLWAYPAFRPEPLVTAGAFSALCVGLSLYLLPRFKGIIVAVQWSGRMGGFDRPDRS